MPYPAISPAEVVELLDSGSRLTQPTNAACSDEMYVIFVQAFCALIEHMHICIDASQF